MKYSIFFFLLLSSMQPCIGQKPADPVQKNKMLEQANIMSHAFLKGDWEAFSYYTYPKLAKGNGGRKAIVQLMEQQEKGWKQKGVSFQSVSIGKATDIVQAGSEWHSIVEQNLVLKVKNGTLKKDGYLLAVSTDKGLHWYFIDMEKMNNGNIRQFFPDFNKSLIIPPHKQPVFIPAS